jgi:hypothetical protein
MEKYPFRSVRAVAPALGPVSTCTRAPEIGKFVESLTSPRGIVTTIPVGGWGPGGCGVLGEDGVSPHATQSNSTRSSK